MVSIEELERSTENAVVARRNMMLGVWAGKRLGLAGDGLARYAGDVMRADYELPGPEDVISKVSNDFAAAGVGLCARAVLNELKSLERRVRWEFATTD
jgi:hypothetical protein